MTEAQRKLEFARMRIALEQAEAARDPYSMRVGSRVPTARNSAANSRSSSPTPFDAHLVKFEEFS